jgi:N6-adenosine-specific RNA methylase IME4
MTLDDIKALPVADVAGRDCLLLMWAVDPLLPQAVDLGRSWGFTYKTVGFCWAKTRRVDSTRGADLATEAERAFPMGTGYWTRANPELCLLFAKGHPKRVSASVRKLLVAPRREHSRKPDETYERIEALVGGPYLELFARHQRPGWSAWGNQVTKFNGGVFA